MAIMPCYDRSPETREEQGRERNNYLMEEQQIQDFVHRVSRDESLRKKLASDPDGVIMREGFSPRVTLILTRLVPQLALDKPLAPSLPFWH